MPLTGNKKGRIMIKKGSKVILNNKYTDWEKFREQKTVLTVSSVGKIGNHKVACFEEKEASGCYALDGLEEVMPNGIIFQT